MLFSEPKIPQFMVDRSALTIRTGFSALQRAENSSIGQGAGGGGGGGKFQCSSASRKFLNFLPRMVIPVKEVVSVLFSEPKIPQ